MTMNKLKFYLLLNALFYLTIGVITLLFSNQLNVFFNIENNLFLKVIGVSIFIFGCFLFYVSQKKYSNMGLIQKIIYLNLFLIFGIIIISFFGLFNLSDKGYLFIMGISILISILTFKQYKYNSYK